MNIDPGTVTVIDLRHQRIETSATPSASTVAVRVIYAAGYEYMNTGSGQQWVRLPDPGSRNYLAVRNLFPASAAAFQTDVDHSAAGLAKAGQVTVRAVATTDYRALVTSPSAGGGGVALDAFVGGDGLVHRYTLAGVVPAGASEIASPSSSPGLTSVRLSIDFYDFGTAGDVVVPTNFTDNPDISGGPGNLTFPSNPSAFAALPT